MMDNQDNQCDISNKKQEKPKKTEKLAKVESIEKSKNKIIRSTRTPISKRLIPSASAASTKTNLESALPIKCDISVTTPKLKLRSKTGTTVTESSERMEPHQSNKNPFASKSHVEASFTASMTSSKQSFITGSMSARASTATIRSDAVAKLHKPGTIPAYLKRNDKHNLRSQIVTKRKIFVIQKKKLAEVQADVQDTYNVLKSLEEKLNKVTGLNDKNSMEDLKLLKLEDLRLSVDNGKPDAFEVSHHIKKKSLPNLKLLNDKGLLNKLEEKLRLIHETGFKLCQESFDQNYKIVAAMKDANTGDSNEFPIKFQTALNEMEQKVLKEENDQDQRISQFIKELQNMLINAEGIPIMSKDSFAGEFKLYKESTDKEMCELNERVKEAQTQLANEEQKRKEFEKKLIQESSIIQTLKNHDVDHNNKLKDKNKELEKTSGKLKTQEQQIKKLEHKVHDLQLKDKSNADLKKELEIAKSRMNQYIQQLEKLKFQKDTLDKEYKHTIDEYLETIKKIENEKRILELQLIETKKIIKRMDDLNTKVDNITSIAPPAENMDPTNREYKLWTEVQSLKIVVERLREEKDSIERDKQTILDQLSSNDSNSITNNKTENDLQIDIIKRNEEINRLKNLNTHLQLEIEKKDHDLNKKKQIISDLDKKIYGSVENTKGFVGNLEKEIVEIRELDIEKNREIKRLRYELAKAHMAIQRHEESQHTHQKILRVRDELLKTIQAKDNSKLCRLSEIYPELNDKNSFINQSLVKNDELKTKTAELLNIFTATGEKQTEKSRQEQLIKMLEDNNKRNQKMRVRQQERVGLLEIENAELKQLIKQMIKDT